MTRCVFLTLLCVASVGCYREPTNPSQVRQNTESSRKAAEPVMPNDDIHAGMAAKTDVIIESREVPVGTQQLTAPDQWVRKQVSSGFLMAEFALPKAEGDAEDGRLTVSSAGGSIESNVDRWKGQFGGKPESESQETIDVHGVQVTWVDFSGAFLDQRGPMMMSAAEPKPGYRMLAAIIPLDGQLYFVKGYGPQKTVDAHAEQIRVFVQSLAPQGGEPASKPAADAK